MLVTEMCIPEFSTKDFAFFRGLSQSATLIRPSVEPSVFVKSLYIHTKLPFSTCTVPQITTQVLHMLVSEMGH